MSLVANFHWLMCATSSFVYVLIGNWLAMTFATFSQTDFFAIEQSRPRSLALYKDMFGVLCCECGSHLDMACEDQNVTSLIPRSKEVCVGGKSFNIYKPQV